MTDVDAAEKEDAMQDANVQNAVESAEKEIEDILRMIDAIMTGIIMAMLLLR